MDNIHVALTERQKPCHREDDVIGLDLDIRHSVSIVLVKIGHLSRGFAASLSIGRCCSRPLVLISIASGDGRIQ